MAPPKPAPPKAVENALATGQPAARAAIIRTWIGTSRGENGKTKVTFVWEPTPEAPGGRGGARGEAPARVSLTAVGPDGAPYFRGRVPAEATPAPVGGSSGDGGAARAAVAGDVRRRARARCSCACRSKARPRRCSTPRLREIAVPDLTAAQTVLGTPEVLRARTVRELQQIKADPDAVPIATREFSRTDRLLIRVPVYGPGDTAPALSVHLLNRAGQPMSELPAAAGGCRSPADRAAAGEPRAGRVRPRDQGRGRAARTRSNWSASASPDSAHAAFAVDCRSCAAAALGGCPGRSAAAARGPGRPHGPHRRRRHRHARAVRRHAQSRRLRSHREHDVACRSRARSWCGSASPVRAASRRGRTAACSPSISTNTTSARAPASMRARAALTKFIDRAARPGRSDRRHEAARFAVRHSSDPRSRHRARTSSTGSRGAGRLHGAQRLRAELHGRRSGAHRRRPRPGRGLGAERAGRQPRRAQTTGARRSSSSPKGSAGRRASRTGVPGDARQRDPLGERASNVSVYVVDPRVAGARRSASRPSGRRCRRSRGRPSGR